MSHRSAGWEIRPHSRDDRSDIQRVFLNCLTEFPWRQNPQREVDTLLYDLKYSTVLVATEPDAGLIGFIVLLTDKAYVSHLFVDPDWRLCGVGGGLLNVGRTLTSRPLQLDVDAKNYGALLAYQALGWTEAIANGHVRSNQRRLLGP